MKRGRSEIVTALLATLTAGVLVVSGLSPQTSFERLTAVARSFSYGSMPLTVTPVVVLALWLVVFVGMTRATLTLFRFIGQTARQWVVSHHSAGRGGVVGLTLVLLATLLSHTRSSNNLVTGEVGHESESQQLGSDAGSRPSRYPEVGSGGRDHADTRDVRRLLPALTSTGLAVGLTGHIQRQRAELLKDAPTSATLRRPSAATLSTAVALFERARVNSETLTQDHQSSRTRNLVIPLGADHDQLVSLTVAPGETVSIDSHASESDDVLRHIINTLALAPWNPPTSIIAHGFQRTDAVVDRSIVYARDAEHAARQALDVRSRCRDRNVVIVTREFSDAFAELLSQGIMVISSIIPSGAVHRVVRKPQFWEVGSTKQRFEPYGLSAGETATLNEAVQEMTQLIDFATNYMRGVAPWQVTSGTSWHTMVRILGPVHAVRHDQQEVTFRKSKSLELLCWLALHRERPTVSGARTALWDLDVRDATFHNVLSELRRGLSAAGLSNAAGRVNRQRLFLDRRIITDGEVLRNALASTEQMEASQSLAELRAALSLVNGLPFMTSNYVWADAEGFTSTLVWLTSSAVRRAAEHATKLGDREGMHDIAAAGLRLFPGEEEFLVMKSRANAGCGGSRLSTTR